MNEPDEQEQQPQEVKELQWSPEFLNRIRAQFSDEEWESAWIETWNEHGSSGRIYLDPPHERPLKQETPK